MPTTSAASPPATAYSYIRFSSSVQGKEGRDSKRRQTEARDKWLVAHPKATLDTTLRMADEGVSGFTGANRSDKACLGAFVRLAEQKRIKRGSYLLVENLDRLSRDEVQEGLELLLALTRHGIRVVQLLPVETEFAYPVEPMRLMIAIMELNRGNSESAMKSERGGSLWVDKRKKAAEGQKILFRLPGWLVRKENGTIETNEHAETVKRMFQLAVDGYGAGMIAKTLNTDKVPTFGTKCRPYWSNSTVNFILHSRAPTGEYQPKTRHKTKGERVKAGQAVPGYFPSVVDEATWARVQQLMKSRTGKRGGKRNGGNGGGRVGRVNLFAGLVYDGLSGCKFQQNTGTRSNLMEPYFTRAARSDGPLSESLPVEVFELAMIREMGNLNLKDLLPATVDDSDELDNLRAERGRIEDELGQIQQAILKGERFSSYSALMSALNQKLDTVNEQIETLSAKEASPISEAVGDLTALLKLVASQHVVETRMRLRSAIQRVVKEIWCVITAHGVHRKCLAQIKFNDGIPDRLVIINYTRAGQGTGWKREMSWESDRFVDPKGVDLSNKGQAAIWAMRAIAPEMMADLSALRVDDE